MKPANMKNRGFAPSKNLDHQALLKDIVHLIQQGRKHVATEVNATVVLLYWSIGKRINDEVLLEKRADYGEQIINNLSKQLTQEFGKGYSRSALFRMVRFAKLYANKQIIATVSRQLSWSHIVIVCQMDNDLQRDFYIKRAITPLLHEHINPYGIFVMDLKTRLAVNHPALKQAA